MTLALVAAILFPIAITVFSIIILVGINKRKKANTNMNSFCVCVKFKLALFECIIADIFSFFLMIVVIGFLFSSLEFLWLFVFILLCGILPIILLLFCRERCCIEGEELTYHGLFGNRGTFTFEDIKEAKILSKSAQYRGSYRVLELRNSQDKILYSVIIENTIGVDLLVNRLSVAGLTPPEVVPPAFRGMENFFDKMFAKMDAKKAKK